jgi:ATP-binding protein involved in chromosome partitioning
MVTTPQAVALADVIKGAEMFRQLDVPILGLIENMSHYLCPHCGETAAIFGEGGGERLSRQLGAPLLAQVPLDPVVRSGGDAGTPVVISHPDSPAGRAFLEVARILMAQVRTRPAPPAATRDYVPDPELSFL